MSEQDARHWFPLPTSDVPKPNLEAMKRRRVISLTTAGCIGALSGSVVLGVSSGIIGGTYQDYKVSVKENGSDGQDRL